MKNFLLARISIHRLTYFYWRPGFDRISSGNRQVGGGGIYWGRWYITMFWKR